MRTNLEPYRVLFPMGLLCGAWGAALWIVFALGLTQNYPGGSHPNVMICGFLFSFASGFLMTAVPRFTGAKAASLPEITIAAVLILGAVAFDAAALWRPAWASAGLLLNSASILFLGVFCFRRFRERTQTPPKPFGFIGVGLLCGFFGSVLVGLGEMQWLSEDGTRVGRALYYQGMMFALVLGAGSRLVPALLGWTPGPLAESPRAVSLCLGAFFLASFPAEYYSTDLGRALRALVATYVAVSVWRVHRGPPVKGVLQRWLRLSGALLVAGLWLPVAAPGYAVHGLHVAFIGGFSLMAILIATRVTLSAGGHDLAPERSSRALTACGVCFVFAAVTRLFANIAPQVYLDHLAYASVCWILAIGIWAVAFGSKLLPRHG